MTKDLKSNIENLVRLVNLYGTDSELGIWQGVDDYKSQKIKVVASCLLKAEVPNNIEDLVEATQPDLEWADLHFEERISGEPLNPGESYKIWPYHNFSDKDNFKRHGGKFSHTYMERYSTHYLNLIQLLKNKPSTRQAYLPIYVPEDLESSLRGDRVPCTLGYHVMGLGDTLYMNYFIRSCDIFRHFRNDIYLTSKLLLHINRICYHDTFKRLEYNMFISNLHLFDADRYAMKKQARWSHLIT